MMMSNLGIYAVIPFISILLYLGIFVFSIYFVVKAITFMNEKTKLDRERNEKLDSLIKIIRDNKNSGI